MTGPGGSDAKNIADADAELAIADVDEAGAHAAYRAVSNRAHTE